jgi:tripartite-type tricarboxylate transporter receptor subunit TctC
MKRYAKVFIPFIVIGLLMSFSVLDSALAEYPEKMITYIVPFKAGGGTDRIARILSTGAIDNFGQAWHVRNIPGASALVGWKELLKRPADGYTIIQGSPTPIISLLKEEKPALKPTDIKIASYVAGFRTIIASKPGTQWSTWEKFKAYARKNPGKITVAGTMSNMIGSANLLSQAGLKVNYVPYESTGTSVADFLGGHVDCLAATASTIAPLIPKKALAVVNTSGVVIPKKKKQFKGVPDAKSLGYEGMFFPRWVGVHPDTPDSLVDTISMKMGKVLKDKSVKRLMSKIGEEIVYLPRSEAEAAYKNMIKSMKKASKLLK